MITRNPSRRACRAVRSARDKKGLTKPTVRSTHCPCRRGFAFNIHYMSLRCHMQGRNRLLTHSTAKFAIILSKVKKLCPRTRDCFAASASLAFRLWQTKSKIKTRREAGINGECSRCLRNIFQCRGTPRNSRELGELVEVCPQVSGGSKRYPTLGTVSMNAGAVGSSSIFCRRRYTSWRSRARSPVSR